MDTFTALYISRNGQLVDVFGPIDIPDTDWDFNAYVSQYLGSEYLWSVRIVERS